MSLAVVWQLVRGGNLLFIFAAVWVGGSIGAADFHVSSAFIGGLTAMCLGAFGNAVNDIYDRDVDAIRKRNRPLPSGKISVRIAWIWSYAFAALAIVGGIMLYPLVLAVVVATLFLLWLYSRTLKGWRGAGHIVVAGFSGLVFVFGALVQGESFNSTLPQAWSAAVLAFLWHLAREWVKSAEDLDADQSAGVQTLAVKLGSRDTCRRAAAALALLVSLLWIPPVAGWFGMTYVLIAVVAIAPTLIGVAYYLWNNPDRDRLSQLSMALKWAMLLGVAAVWLG